MIMSMQNTNSLHGVLMALEPRVNGDWRMVVVMSYV